MTIAGIIDKIRQNSLVKDSSWTIIGSAMGKGLSMVAGIIIARLLGAELYGEYGMVKSTLAYVATFSTFGLGYTATKYIAQCRPDDLHSIRNMVSSSIKITLTTSGIMAILLLLSANSISATPELVPMLRYTALIIVFNAINAAQTGILSGLKKFREIAINSTIVGITTFVLGTTLTYFYSLDGAVIALFIATVTQCVLNYYAVRRYYRNIKTDSHYADNAAGRQVTTKELLKFSLPIALQECVFASASWLRVLVLMHLAGADELGLYTVSNQWFILILFVPGALRNVILSHLSSSANDNSRHANIFSYMLKINIVATVIPAMAIAIGSPLICYFYGHTFVGLLPVLLIAVTTSVFGCIAGIYTQEFISRGKNWTILVGYIFREFGALGLAMPLLTVYGTRYGALIMYVAVLVAHIAYCAILKLKYDKTFM